MAEAVIVEAVRPPIGKRNDGLSGVHPAELSAQVLNGLVQKAGVDPEIVDDVIWGCVMQAGEQALDIGRTALLTAGWPEKKLNPNGGAIALGHPLGGSGARIMTTMLYHMRDKGIRYGLQTMCEGGGQANATILELL